MGGGVWGNKHTLTSGPVQSMEHYYCSSPGTPSIPQPWTCHWFLIYTGAHESAVVDLDSTLAPYTDVRTYISSSFRNQYLTYKVFDAEEYCRLHARKHRADSRWYLSHFSASVKQMDRISICAL